MFDLITVQVQFYSKIKIHAKDPVYGKDVRSQNSKDLVQQSGFQGVGKYS